MSLPAVAVTQTPEAKFREYLATRARAQRFTEQQREMVAYIFSQHSHFDAEELLDAMKRDGIRVSRATAYRTLAKLVDAGLLRRLEIGPRTHYEHDYGYPQHDHLVCTRCKKMIEFQRPEIDQVIRDVCSEHLFQIAGHTLFVRGVCAECNRARGNRRLDLV
ncbi:MAG: transcriptional repressor [Gemmataceae bacterium]|nr:transcriptional repressor [Gemmataceae bacterium]